MDFLLNLLFIHHSLLLLLHILEINTFLRYFYLLLFRFYWWSCWDWFFLCFLLLIKDTLVFLFSFLLLLFGLLILLPACLLIFLRSFFLFLLHLSFALLNILHPSCNFRLRQFFALALFLQLSFLRLFDNHRLYGFCTWLFDYIWLLFSIRSLRLLIFVGFQLADLIAGLRLDIGLYFDYASFIEPWTFYEFWLCFW